MNLLLSVSTGLTFGLIFGFFISIYKRTKNRKVAYEKNRNKIFYFLKSISKEIIIVTFIMLFISLIWTGYFLILGIVDKTQTDYAQNISQLIVSVVTIFSIIIAFYQFLVEKK